MSVAVHQVGRNDTCPCGSGKKYKKCCAVLRKSEQRAASGSVAADDVRSLFRLIETRRYRELELQATDLSRRFPQAGLVWKALGLSLWVQGKDAVGALQRAAQLLPLDAEAHSNLGNALRACGRLEDALASQRTALSLKPSYAAAHNDLGSIFRDLNRLEEARASFARAISLDRNLAMAHANLGAVLQRLNRLEEAAASYRLAAKLNPDFVEAFEGAGNVSLQLRQFDHAASSFKRVVELRPQSCDAHGNFGNAQRELGRFEEALVSYGLALALSPGHAELHNNLGNVLLDLGRPAEALESYARAIELKPDFAKAFGNRGAALRELGQLDQAEASCRQALSLQPSVAELHQNLGTVLKLQGRIADAEICCRKALELNPDSATAATFLGELLADKGLFAEAEILFLQAIALEPDLAPAWAGIPSVRKMSTEDGEWAAQALRIAASSLRPRDEMHLRFAIGKFLDDVHDYEQAFANYRRANQLSKLNGQRYDPQLMSETFGYIAQFYDADWTRQSFAEANRSARPVFVVGMPRSGTSLAEQILASHPAVFGAGELPFWKTASVSIAMQLQQTASVDAVLTSLADEYLQRLYALSANAARVIDKMPANFSHLGLIHAALPNARIIHMRRNPADTCLSIYFQNFHAAHSYASDLNDLAHFYRQYLRLMEHWRTSLPPGTMLEVPYEELVNDTETWSRRMVEFVGLPWDPACLEFHRTARVVNTFSKWQVRQKISHTSVQRWRHYADYVAPLAELEASIGR